MPQKLLIKAYIKCNTEILLSDPVNKLFSAVLKAVDE